jgi:hypothetical protein
MREIKFRAWDGEIMRTDVSIDSDGLVIASWGKEKHDWIPLQYTGLKDKNGKEIYDGDVMRCGDILVVTFGHYSGENEGWYLRRAADGYQYSMHAFTKPWLVIGNIYENEHLLKEVSDVRESDRDSSALPRRAKG